MMKREVVIHGEIIYFALTDIRINSQLNYKNPSILFSTVRLMSSFFYIVYSHAVSPN